MTPEQKISILIRKYGAKSIIRDSESSLNGVPSSFVYNKVLPKQVWIDLRAVPQRNPLKTSPVNLSQWPSVPNTPIIVKIIKKSLTWIKGTNAFYDPGSPENLSTVEDIISPNVDPSYYPEIFVLDTESNEYLETISTNRYNWIFDYESGCLIFPDGIPSFIISPEFQPPAITCYRYIGRKDLSGISTDLIQGPTGPIGPTGERGETQYDSMIWRGEYLGSSLYSKNDAFIKDGVVFVKKTGPTGPTDVTSSYCDSITYNEFSDGFIESYNEKYVDLSYTSDSPYFETLDDASSSMIIGPSRTQDQSIRIFNLTGPQEFISGTIPPYSNRLFFYSPKKLNTVSKISLMGSGYRSLILDNAYLDSTEIGTTSFLNLEASKIIDSEITFIPNSSILSSLNLGERIPKEITGKIEKSFFSTSSLRLNGDVFIDYSTFNESSLYLGDQGANYFRLDDNIYNGVIHYFKNSRFIDSDFIAEYSGEYSRILIIFDKCLLNYTKDLEFCGFSFPNPPENFNSSITILFIDSIVSSKFSRFRILDNSNVLMLGTNQITPNITASIGSTVITSLGGVTSGDPTLNLFLSSQNLYGTDPRETTNFYYNQ